jgi:peptidyl-dipeptidase Dcp
MLDVLVLASTLLAVPVDPSAPASAAAATRALPPSPSASDTSGLALIATANPFSLEWTTPFGVPPFELIRPEHFLPALEGGMAEHNRELAAIAESREAPSFANTLEALDATGERLDRVEAVFQNLTSAETSDALQALAKKVAPLLAAHRDDVYLNAALFARIKTVHDARARLELTADESRLLERTYKDFVRAGATLADADKERLRVINGELASLSVKFSDDVLKEMNAYRLVIDDPRDLDGLPERVVAGAADAAAKAGLPGKWVFTLHAPSLWPFLQYARNRELRRQLFTAYTTRGDHGDATDNKAALARIAALRAERARLFGYATFADFTLDDAMAGTPARVYELLERLWKPARKVARKELEAMQALAKAAGQTGPFEPWDWFYWAEKVRQTRLQLDEQTLRPYFQLDRVRDGAFHVAGRLYGLTFTPLEGIPVYNPEVRAFEVKEADGRHLAVLYLDYHPRPGKRGGAWSSRYRDQHWRDGKRVQPIVVNVCNFSRPAAGAPALLSVDEVETLFHELGHALHGMLSEVRYRRIARVPRDFVELPSQIMENWALEPEVLAVYARHYQTNEPIPLELVRRVREARKLNQGFATVEYLAASVLDMDWHTLPPGPEREATAFERASMSRLGLPAEIIPRYRSPYFSHIFAGGYASGYYAYIWAEVLDADAFSVFTRRGLFDPATAKAFRELLSRGGSDDAMTLYRRFRGGEPSIEPLLERRGLN